MNESTPWLTRGLAVPNPYLLASLYGFGSAKPLPGCPMSLPTVEVAIAILYQGEQFLMQLRDDIPGIYYPGQWGFFGGHIEPGETPDVAVKRELLEEIGYRSEAVTLFARLESSEVIRHVFYAPLTVCVDTLELHEGWDLGLLSITDIERGDRYSARANQVRPLGQPHQKILLDFWQQDFWQQILSSKMIKTPDDQDQTTKTRRPRH